VRQRIDDVTGKRQWKVTVPDPSETNSKRASYDVMFLPDVQPSPTTAEVQPGMRPIELVGLTAEPKVLAVRLHVDLITFGNRRPGTDQLEHFLSCENVPCQFSAVLTRTRRPTAW
jgi:hypothetical protein